MPKGKWIHGQAYRRNSITSHIQVSKWPNPPNHYHLPSNVLLSLLSINSCENCESLTTTTLVDSFLIISFVYSVLFQKQNLLHVYLVPSHSSAFGSFCLFFWLQFLIWFLLILDWFGVMFIHTTNGLYAGIILRFTVFISASYPNCDVPVSILFCRFFNYKFCKCIFFF